MTYNAGIDYPEPKDLNKLHPMRENLHQVTVLPGPKCIEAYPNDCIDNALRFKEMYDVEVVRGYIGNSDYLIEHYWNFDGFNYYDVTPFTKDKNFKFSYYLEKQ